jgi:hypothetical protein
LKQHRKQQSVLTTPRLRIERGSVICRAVFLISLMAVEMKNRLLLLFKSLKLRDKRQNKVSDQVPYYEFHSTIIPGISYSPKIRHLEKVR